MSLLKKIDEDLIKALKNGNRDDANTLRGLKSNIKYFQIDKRPDKLTEDDIVGVLNSAAKQRRDSIEQFAAGGRDDLVSKETHELKLIQAYLPKQLTQEEITDLVMEAITETGASNPSDLGKVMKSIMPKTKGRADGKVVKEVVGRLLSA